VPFLLGSPFSWFSPVFHLSPLYFSPLPTHFLPGQRLQDCRRIQPTDIDKNPEKPDAIISAKTRKKLL
jgi:hypothetical protein